MIIHSKFRDYYDSVQQFGSDQTVRYIRNEEVVDGYLTINFDQTYIKSSDGTRRYIDYDIHNFQDEKDSKYEVMISQYLISICGIPYSVFVGNFYLETRQFPMRSETFVSDSEEGIIQEVEKKTGFKYIKNRRVSNFYADVGKLICSKIDSVDLNQYHFKAKSPILLLCRERSNPSYSFKIDHIHLKMIKDVRLSGYQFQKIIDPFTIFQMISGYIGGVLPSSGKETVELTDIERVVKHGFDKKSSFRKGKENA